MVNADVLGFPNFDYPFIPETDASLKGYHSIVSKKIDEIVIIMATGSKMIIPVKR